MQLATVVEVQPRDRKRFKRLLEETKNFESLPLRTRLTDEEVARFAANRYRFPGVEIKARLFRQYPFGEVASHVIGYISRINEKDVERIEDWNETANYKGSDYIGKVGVELAYERELHGTTGWEEVEVDAGGRAVRTLSRTPPISGNNLKLALDIKLQQAAEAAFGDRRGALVAIEPTTGDVLAFVSKPGFDPNLFVDGIDPANWDAAQRIARQADAESAAARRLSAGLDHQALPGARGADFGQAHAAQTIFDPGFYQIAGAAHRFRDDKPGGHGYVDMSKSIVVSCDTYYYMLAGETDIDDTYAFLSQFGFGRKTGIDIEGELVGVLPSRAWKRERFNGGAASGIWATRSRQASARDTTRSRRSSRPHAIAIDRQQRRRLAPHLVKSVEDVRDGSVTADRGATHAHAPRQARAPGELIRSALVGVTKEGTSAEGVRGRAVHFSAARRAPRRSYSLKGEKYSTKVDERLRDHAWYIAYAPADHPSIAHRGAGREWWIRRRRPRRRSRAPCSTTISSGRRRPEPRRPAAARARPTTRATKASRTMEKFYALLVPDLGNPGAPRGQLPHGGGAGDRRHRPHHALFGIGSEHRTRHEPGAVAGIRAGADVDRGQRFSATARASRAAALCRRRRCCWSEWRLAGRSSMDRAAGSTSALPDFSRPS